MSDELLRRAGALWGRGLSVIPILERGKKPAIAWADYQQRVPSMDEIADWFGNGRPFNIAIVTGAVSGVVAVDCDSPEAIAWADSHLPATEMRTRTGRGGEHRFYRHPGTPVRNKVKIQTDRDRLALDIRADGGYVIAPGSVHESGTVYERLGTWPPIEALPVFDPSWIAAEPVATPPLTAAGSRLGSAWTDDRDHLLRRARAYVAKVPPAIEGQGGDAHTFQLACKLVRGFALSDADAFDLLREWNSGCQPPWTDRALEEKIRGAGKYGAEAIGGRAATAPAPRQSADPHDRNLPTSSGSTADGISRPFACTDTGNAEAFACWFGDEWRFDNQRGVWRHWESPIWSGDADGLVYRHAKSAMRRRYREAEMIRDLGDRTYASKWAIGSESRARLDACLFLTAKEEPIADAGANWDEDRVVLACPNGVVELRTGECREGRQADRLTMCAAVPYEPGARCPRFERFMLEVTGGDRELVHYLHRALGYSITGDISEQCLWFLYGPGSGGKTTLLRHIGSVLGSYAYTAPFSTFLKDQHGSTITNDLATLQGKRFVPASEVRERAKLDEGRIKSLTGGDDMTARFLHQEFFTFRPRLHLWLAVNHKPIVTDDSFGFWRRVRAVPFTQRFPITPTLDAELQAEAPGILAWLVRGCLLWQMEGLEAPASVTTATAEYEEDSDPLADFLAAACELDANASIGASEFYKLYAEWADRHGRYESRSAIADGLRAGHARAIHEGPDQRVTCLSRRRTASHDGFGSMNDGLSVFPLFLPMTLSHEKKGEQPPNPSHPSLDGDGERPA